MSLIAAAIHAAEGLPAPDVLRRAAISWLVEGQRRELLALPASAAADFARDMRARPIAEHVDAANDQHYELPPEFFRLVLGPRLKYSSGLYRTGSTLAEAEEIGLSETCRHAGLVDGQRILELGCGWGSLSLWMAEHYPHARITAVSNSHGQRRHIEAQARERRLGHLTVLTCDANPFEPREPFRRIVPVETFEHMANWDQLLGRARSWLEPDGRLFLHVFSSQTAPYRFTHEDPSDWIGKYFFTGGFMPSHDLIRDFGDIFTVEADWRWSGKHYEKTALDWLANMDRHDLAIRRLMRDVYGKDAELCRRRWRLFFLANAGLFGQPGREGWGVPHHPVAPPSSSASSSVSAFLAAMSAAISAPSLPAASRKAGSPSSRATASAIFSGEASRSSIRPAPRDVTRMALSRWSRRPGRTSRGRPAISGRITEPWPPWVTNSAALSNRAPCGAVATTWTLPGAGNPAGSSAGPRVTRPRTGRAPRAAMVRRSRSSCAS